MKYNKVILNEYWTGKVFIVEGSFDRCKKYEGHLVYLAISNEICVTSKHTIVALPHITL